MFSEVVHKVDIYNPDDIYSGTNVRRVEIQ